MTVSTQKRLGNSRQRGFWLRCFLGGVIFMLAAMGPVAVFSRAQCVERTIRASRIQGLVLDPYGRPIPNVMIELRTEDKIIATATADETGRFSIHASPGECEIVAKARGFETTYAALDVGNDLVRAIRPTRLFMILDVRRALLDQCSFTTTSRREFEKLIRENTQKR